MTALRLVFAATLALALTGCGRTATAGAAAPIETTLGQKPTAGAKLAIGTQIQEREDGEAEGSDTTKVGAPTSDKLGFRKD